MKYLLNFSVILLLILPAVSIGNTINTDASVALETQTNTLSESQQQYIFPMAIPATQSEREKLISRLENIKDPQQRKLAYLTRLALVTNKTDAPLSDIERLQEDMSALREVLIKDPELMAAHGSLIAFKTTFFLNDLSKLSVLSRQGNRLMDRAIKLNPNHLGARLQRGIACAHMPSFVRRARYAVTDLELLKSEIADQYGEEFKQFIEFNLALAYSRNRQLSDAKELWKKLAMGKNTWSEKSKLALKDL